MKDISFTHFENTCNAVTVIFLELIFSTAFQILLYKCVYIDHTYVICTHFVFILLLFYTSLFVLAQIFVLSNIKYSEIRC